MNVPVEWVEQHKQEIEECAFQLHKERSLYGQRDDKDANFLRAITKVWERRNGRL